MEKVERGPGFSKGVVLGGCHCVSGACSGKLRGAGTRTTRGQSSSSSGSDSRANRRTRSSHPVTCASYAAGTCGHKRKNASQPDNVGYSSDPFHLGLWRERQGI